MGEGNCVWCFQGGGKGGWTVNPDSACFCCNPVGRMFKAKGRDRTQAGNRIVHWRCNYLEPIRTFSSCDELAAGSTTEGTVIWKVTNHVVSADKANMLILKFMFHGFAISPGHFLISPFSSISGGALGTSVQPATRPGFSTSC